MKAYYLKTMEVTAASERQDLRIDKSTKWGMSCWFSLSFILMLLKFYFLTIPLIKKKNHNNKNFPDMTITLTWFFRYILYP